MKLAKIHSPDDIIKLVRKYGFLPFFRNGIEGFSIEECCPPELWFSDTLDGPWEWKGPIAHSKTCIYGKFFSNKAGFVSREIMPDFLNYRRDGYDLDAAFDDGLIKHKDRAVFDVIYGEGDILSKALKRMCDYRKGGNVGFDTVITRLQMKGYVCVSDFEYMTDKNGRQYGWGVARYSTPEALFGYDEATVGYKREPSESFEIMVKQLSSVLKWTDEQEIRALLKG